MQHLVQAKNSAVHFYSLSNSYSKATTAFTTKPAFNPCASSCRLSPPFARHRCPSLVALCSPSSVRHLYIAQVSVMVVWRGLYSAEDLAEALARVKFGETYAEVARTSSVPLRTLFKHANRKTKGIQPQRRGTKPLLSAEIEDDIVQWNAGRQREGRPTSRQEIIAAASEAYTHMAGRAPTRSTPKQLSNGWYWRFRARHPCLTARMAQTIQKSRNQVEFPRIDILFHTMVKLIVEERLESSI